MSRYSQLYVDRPAQRLDGQRARHRLWSILSQRIFNAQPGETLEQKLDFAIGSEIGIPIPRRAGSVKRNWEQFFNTVDVADLLDTITVVAGVLQKQTQGAGDHWLRSCSIVFEEEGLSYRIGDDKIVHPYVDEEFEFNRVSAVAALSVEGFAEALHDFNESFRHLRNGEGKQALRMMFPAIEVVVKILFPGRISRLMPKELDVYLKPVIERLYIGNQPALDASKQGLEAFKKWIVASQVYRHGQEVQEPAEVPTELVVLHLSLGASFIRWIIDLTKVNGSDVEKVPFIEQHIS